jgi:hypothetical protein
MRTFKCTRSLMLFVLLTATSNASDKATSPRLELKVNELKASEGEKAFSAELTNTTSKSIPIELIQLPSGYSGGGMFYPCAMQFWNAQTKQWQTLPPGNRRSAHSVGQFLHSKIKPDETIAVCRQVLTKERIKGGRCARFAFTFRWDHKPDILSKPFSILDPQKSGKPTECLTVSQ